MVVSTAYHHVIVDYRPRKRGTNGSVVTHYRLYAMMSGRLGAMSRMEVFFIKLVLHINV